MTHVCNRVFVGSVSLNGLEGFPLAVRRTLVKSLILHLFDYCSIAYDDVSKVRNEEIQRLLKYFIHYIFDVQRDKHTPRIFKHIL